jgi:hypothetical protein
MRVDELTGVALQVAVLAAYGIWKSDTQVGSKTVQRFCFVDGEGVSCVFSQARAIFDFKTGDYVRLDEATVARLCDEFNISVQRLRDDKTQQWAENWHAFIGQPSNGVADPDRDVAACKTLVKEKFGAEFDVDAFVKGV